MLEVLKCLIPLVLAATFVYAAATFASMGFKKKEERRFSIVGATFIELLSFTIWIPNLSELFTIIGFEEKTKTVAMVVSVMLIVFGSIAATMHIIKQEET